MRCRDCGRPVSQKHASDCAMPRVELREKNSEQEEPPRRRSAFSIASTSILGEL